MYRTRRRAVIRSYGGIARWTGDGNKCIANLATDEGLNSGDEEHVLALFMAFNARCYRSIVHMNLCTTLACKKQWHKKTRMACSLLHLEVMQPYLSTVVSVFAIRVFQFGWFGNIYETDKQEELIG